MKKSLWIAALVLALTTGVVGTAYAEESSLPPGPGGPGQGDGEGPLHELMIEAAANVLGLETAELEARLADGETLHQIALDLGLDAQEFQSEWAEARRTVIETAVEDGLIERFQVRRMIGRRAQMRNSEWPGLGVFRNSPQSR
jgi:hypothetical protein